MFIWTISDVIGVIVWSLFILFFGGIFLSIKIGDWRQSRRLAKKRRAQS